MKEAKPDDNHRLLRLVGETVTDWPCSINDRYACFENKLEVTLREELGRDRYDRWFAECQRELDITAGRDATKNPVLFEMLLKKAKEADRSSESLEGIARRVVALR